MIELNDETRLIQALVKHLGCQCPTIQFTAIDDQRGIAVLYISAGTLPVATVTQLKQLIFQGNLAILCFATLRRPYAVGVAVLNGEVKCATIRAGLAVGDDMQLFQRPSYPKSSL